MAYIVTSKTRRASPHGKVVLLRDNERRETRVCDERKADELLRYSRWGTQPKTVLPDDSSRQE